MNKTITIDDQTFSQKEVKLTVSAPRPGTQLIGFDRSFISNRTQNNPPIDIYELLNKTYSVIKNHNNCNFYLPDYDLYIDDRTNQYNNFSAYSPKNKWHQNCLNQLIETDQTDFIKTWCITDLQKRESMSGKKYLELFEVNSKKDLDIQIIRAFSGMEYLYDIPEMKNEYLSITSNNTIQFDKNVTSNKIILTYQPHFYREENNLYLTDFLWRRQLIDNCKAFLYKKEHELNDKEMLRQIKIAGLHNGFSHHSPFWIKSFILKYNIKSIYDPCGGWGQRLLGAHAIPYIYNDIDQDTVNGSKAIAKLLDIKDKSFYNNDAAGFTPQEDYEAVFTCPPYFDTEIYYGALTSTNQFQAYTDWLNVWWRNLIKASIKPSTKYLAFIINNQYKDDMGKICTEEGLEFVEEIKIAKASNKNHFQRTAKNEFKGEQILVFKIKLNEI
jgi:hypothetical protein